MSIWLRNLPSVHVLLEHEEVRKLIELQGRDRVKEAIQDIMSTMRQNHENYTFSNSQNVLDYIICQLKEQATLTHVTELKRVINATGTVLHTNLGRSPVAKLVMDKVAQIAQGYCNLEYDLNQGKRGYRDRPVEALLMQLTGCESALVVNNNASAVFLCLQALAKDQEVIVSRGEQVEIGGSFRVPDIIHASGCKMIEVGTTNKTYVEDYEKAISEETAMLLKIHQSNYRIKGFTHETSREDLIKLAENRQLIAIEDLGSGTFVDWRKYGLPYEPTVQEVLNKGMDIVTISGDKLLGGPQAGIIMGKKEYLDKIKRHPLMRMLRVDKTTLMALQEVLRLYVKGEHIEELPSLGMMSQSYVHLKKRGGELGLALSEKVNHLAVDLVDIEDQPGGGSLPDTWLKGVALSIALEMDSVDQVQAQLRRLHMPIICRVKDNKLLFSIRTIEVELEDVFLNELADVLKEVS